MSYDGLHSSADALWCVSIDVMQQPAQYTPLFMCPPDYDGYTVLCLRCHDFCVEPLITDAPCEMTASFRGLDLSRWLV